MDWTLMADHYIELLSNSLYWVLMAIWLALPYAGVSVLLWLAYRGGRAMTPNARKDRRMEKELQAILEEADHHGR